FFMMLYDVNLLKATNTMIIDASRDIMNKVIDNGTSMNTINEKFGQLIYELYKNMLKYYYSLKFCGILIDKYRGKLINMTSNNELNNELSEYKDYVNDIAGINQRGYLSIVRDIGLGFTENDINTCTDINYIYKDFKA